MAYETKFICVTDADGLTERVNAAEREGWEFVGVKLAVAPNPYAAPPTPGINTKPIPPTVATMLATLRRAKA